MADLSLRSQCRRSRRAVTTLSLDRQFDVDRLLFLAQRPAQFRQRDILQLTNTLAGHAKLLADFLKRLRLSAVEPKPLKDDLLLAIVENVEQTADFVAQVFVPQQLERRLRIFVTDDFAELGRIIIADRSVE